MRQDFVHARRKTLERAFAATADSDSVGDEIEFIAAHGLSWEYYDQVARAIAGMTWQRIEALVKSELAAERELILVAAPGELAESIFESAGIKRFRRLE